ncbi:MAG: hypothetical protein GX318_00760 [Clostridia bacterium]|nr:hypothetical protein [Clostridia bacterium]
MGTASKKRIYIILAMLYMVFLLLFLRLAHLQLVMGDQLSVEAVKNHTSLIAGEDVPRGCILDRNGLTITDTRVTPTLMLFPEILGKDEEIWRLSEILGVPKSVIRGKVKGNNNFIPNLSRDQVREIESANIMGAYVIPLKTRYGPGSLARHIVGHVNNMDEEAWDDILKKDLPDKNEEDRYKITDIIGVKGIEKIYEKYLRGETPEFYWLASSDAHGRVIPGLSFKQFVTETSIGRNQVVLTLDSFIQGKVEEVMDSRDIRGAVVVMDVFTGDVLAMASRPNYDQNVLGVYLDSAAEGQENAFNNRALDPYHPASIFKILIAAAALEEGVVDPWEEFFCKGEYVFDSGLVMNCWNKGGHGRINFKESLAHSCNCVFIELALRLGREKIMEYSEKLHLNNTEVIGYPVPAFKSVNIAPYGEGKIGNAALGQEGVRLSPLQISVLVSTIANGGLCVKPRLLREIRGPQGDTIKEFKRGKGDRTLSEKTALELQEMLFCTTQWGTGVNAWIPGYGSAGKTGSAETGSHGAKINAWFAGYIPLDEPRYTVVVLAEGGRSGGDTAAPVFKEIGDFIMKIQ